MTDPVDETLTAFARLGRRLARGRPLPGAGDARTCSAPSSCTRRVRRAARRVVSAEAVPFRPHRGVYLRRRATRPTAATVDAWWQLARRRSTCRPSSPPTGSPACTSFRSTARLGDGRRPGRAVRHRRAVGPRRAHRHGRLPRRRRGDDGDAPRPRSCERAGRHGAVTPEARRARSAAPSPTRPGRPGRRLSRCASAWSAPTR